MPPPLSITGRMLGLLVTVAVVLMSVLTLGGCGRSEQPVETSRWLSVVINNGSVRTMPLDQDGATLQGNTLVSNMADSRPADIFFTDGAVVQLLASGDLRWLGFDGRADAATPITDQLLWRGQDDDKPAVVLASAVDDKILYVLEDDRVILGLPPFQNQTLRWPADDVDQVVMAAGDGNVVALVDSDATLSVARLNQLQNATVLAEAVDLIDMHHSPDGVVMLNADGSVDHHNWVTGTTLRLSTDSAVGNIVDAVSAGQLTWLRTDDGALHVANDHGSRMVMSDVNIVQMEADREDLIFVTDEGHVQRAKLADATSLESDASFITLWGRNGSTAVAAGVIEIPG